MKHTALLKRVYYQVGKYTVEWNAVGMTSGIYFCTLKANGISETGKMLLLK
ncbi:hypothetical protein ACFL47_08715 [Candidatus Latescibacterota bacterium]